MGRKAKKRVIVPTISEKEIDSIHLAIGKIIKTKREALDSTIDDFAYQVNLSRSGLIRIEKGQDLTIRSLLKVLRGLNITPDELFRTVTGK
ncbi:helix-turn-helix transcriptional regulator [Pseudoflavitalea sp. G-6-1-2]|uniref:helix-turn-helix domain-containing protein n=1 Tax=Pseudoflavitalea sp. G-6-1-2 TaxID=2728841 RepID=UPI00146E3197|nr:helix-turn-helix transcriptional regulator [Pseudoflavitalea sp. G-6-1-2]NML21803.1 helix-turn-helix transcriptional regulator [Pseudoflavitalea sp. G-6-1-2]